MSNLLRPRIWPSFSPSCRLYEPEAWRPRVSAPATYRSGTETNTLRLPGGSPILFALAALRSVPQAGSQFRGLATAIHEISGLVDYAFRGLEGLAPML
jgi:hypothetical protein